MTETGERVFRKSHEDTVGRESSDRGDDLAGRVAPSVGQERRTQKSFLGAIGGH
jgi:hypothetical protein